MNKYYIVALRILMALFVSSCSNNSDEMADWMYWTHENQSPENIKYDYKLDATSKLYLEVNYKGGDVTLICNNYHDLLPIGRDGSNTYDCGWGVFVVDGRQVKCHFPEDALGKENVSDQIIISAMSGNEIVNTILYVDRYFGELVPEPDTEELSDKYKFKLVRGAFMPFMYDDFSIPAPLDNISFKITDYYDRFQVIGFPEFTQYYDSIVWCADEFPNTVRVYERMNIANSTEEHFSSQWSTHFFKSADIKTQLKGYRDGKVVFSTSLATYIFERDFLCYDWINGSVVILNPGNSGVYCLLDQRYEYQAGHTQEMNGTRYAHINVWNKDGLSGEELFSYKREGLVKLMADNIGPAQSPAGKIGSFKCLQSEGVEAMYFWENQTTRIILLHRLADEDYGFEDCYLHFEAK